MRLWTASVVLLLTAAAPAVTPATWDHATEADFTKGEFDKTVVSSLGEVRLGRRIDILMPPESAPAVVSAVVRAGKTIYVADGTEPVIYRIENGKASRLAKLPGAMVASLIWTGKDLLAGTGGSTGAGIYRVGADGEVATVWADKQVRYVWAIVRGGPGRLYAATGPEGKVYAVEADGKARAIYEAGKSAKNILCLAISKGPGAPVLYAGTDEKGLVVRIDPRKKSSRIILDAAEKEIAALIVDENGGVYAATSEAAKAGADGGPKPNHIKAGRAEKPAAKTKPAPTPKNAKPPATTKPPAGKASSAKRAMNGPPVPPEIMARISRAAGRAGPGRPSAPPAPRGAGNAVYYIHPDGLVETRFRRPVTVLAMLRRDEVLYLGTGNGGAIYSVAADGDEVIRLADTDAKLVTSLAFGPDGELVFGTSDKGSVGLLEPGLAEVGTFTSEVLDAKQVAQWGTMRAWARVGQGAKVSIATRSGNVKEPDEATWSSWSKDQPASEGFLTIGSPAGRFLQYRLKLTRRGDSIPVVQHVRIIYQVGNLPPAVSALTVTPSDKGASRSTSTGGAKAFRHVAVKASDPNGDRLSFTIEFRQKGAKAWIRIAKDLKEPKYVWDTRTVPDGAYELRVRASDSPSNAPASALTAGRISNILVVDNTAPVVRDLGAKPADGKVLLSGSAVDATSRIVSLQYAVDSQDEWVVMAPLDGIADADSESFRVELTDLKPGPHRIAVKVIDLYGNAGYASIGVTVGK